jgi:hypothetical protein
VIGIIVAVKHRAKSPPRRPAKARLTRNVEVNSKGAAAAAY